ncbi:MAG TPA: ATP-binding protein [Isosphaeraceae bacterium]|nr:ATP-binding protein [Isosphaeraceae bacterium]
MFTRLTIYQKGLLLIALPLVVQATFVGLLIQSQLAALASQEWAFHTKQVIAKVSDVYQILSDACSAIGAELFVSPVSVDSTSRMSRGRVLMEIHELESLVSDNPLQGVRVREFAARAEPILRWLETEGELVGSGRSEDARKRVQVGAQLLGELRSTMHAILAEEKSLDQKRMEDLRRTTTNSARTAVIGGGAVLALTLGLSLLFFHGLLKRLAILRDNARRFAEGEDLRAPMTGGDEISDVDRAFHDMAAKLNQQKQENDLFVYSVSHDLRSPLINLQGFSEELNYSCTELKSLFHRADVPGAVSERGLGLLSENVEESIRYIHTAVGRLASIIDALLRLSRVGRVIYQSQMTDVSSIVARVVDSLHDSISAARAEVSVGRLPPAWGDPAAIEKIFANLITNAVQYLDEKRPGRIEVGSVDDHGAQAPDDHFVYFVRDNGLGIPEAYHSRVFTPFNRLHADVAQGEGVGLALVARVVERLGGRIWLQSSAGVGSTFFVALPSRSLAELRITVDGSSPFATALEGKAQNGI